MCTNVFPQSFLRRYQNHQLERAHFDHDLSADIIVAACCTILLTATLHGATFEYKPRQKVAGSYLKPRKKDGMNWLFIGRQAVVVQMTFNDIDNGQEEISSTVERQMKLLPEVIRIPFEEAVSDVKLESWEDEWFSSGIFDHERYGSLTKPKIDFVYNCTSSNKSDINR